MSAIAVTSQSSIPAMSSHSAPITPKTCWHRSTYDGLTERGTAALRTWPGCNRVRSTSQTACVCFKRVPGADDEPDAQAKAALSGVVTVDELTAWGVPTRQRARWLP